MRPSANLGFSALLATATVGTAIGIDGTLPAMPAMVEAFGTDQTSIQVTLSAFMVGIAVGQLVHGPLADRFGRKPVIMGNLFLASAAAAGCAASVSVEMLTASRFLHGLAASAGFIVARAAIRDRHDTADAVRIIATLLFFHALAPMLSPLVGAELVVAFGWNAMFAFIAVYSAAVAVLYGLVFRETLRDPDRDALRFRPMIRNFGVVCRSLPFWAYTTCSAAAYGMLFSFLAASSHVVITDFGESARTYGYGFGGCMVGTMIGMLTSAWLVHRHGSDRLLRFGVSFAVATGLVMVALSWAGVHHWLAVMGPMFFCMLAFSHIFPQSVAGAMQPFPGIAGFASSMAGFVQQVVGASTGILVAAFSGDGTQTALALGVLFWALTAFATCFVAIRRYRTI